MLAVVVTETSRQYLEKDVGSWLCPHQLPHQMHRLIDNLDPVLEKAGPNCKSEQAVTTKKLLQLVAPPTSSPNANTSARLKNHRSSPHPTCESLEFCQTHNLDSVIVQEVIARFGA